MEKSCINKLIVISWVAVMLPISQQSSAGLDGKVNGNMFETRRHLLHTRMGSGHSPSRVHPVVPPYINNNSNSSSSPSGRHRNAQVLHDRAIARSLGYLFPNLETASHMDRRSGHGPEDRGSSGGQSSHPSSFVTHGNFEDYDFNVVRFQNVSASGSSSIRNPQNGIQMFTTWAFPMAVGQLILSAYHLY